MPSLSQCRMLFLGGRVNPGGCCSSIFFFHRASFPPIHKSNAYVQFKVDETKLCNLSKRLGNLSKHLKRIASQWFDPEGGMQSVGL